MKPPRALWDIRAGGIVFCPCRQLYRHGRALVRAFLHPNGAAVEIGDLPHQRKSQSRAAVLAAEGLVHAEKGPEDALPKLLRDAAGQQRRCSAAPPSFRITVPPQAADNGLAQGAFIFNH